jgi:hypothetical protein
MSRHLRQHHGLTRSRLVVYGQAVHVSQLGSRGFRAGLALVWCGVLVLGWNPGAVEAHAAMRVAVDAPLGDDAGAIGPVPAATGRPAQARPAASAGTTGSAWPWPIVPILAGIAAGARRHGPRGLALLLALLLAVFASEAAIHSVHHLADPRQAERCPVHSASQHVAGLSAGPATPELPPLAPTRHRPVLPTVQVRAPVADGPQSRAPPASRSSLALVRLTRLTV